MINHRKRVDDLLKDKVFAHQRRAARNTISAFDIDCRTVIMAAEMQSGKSGVALALACMQRNSLSEEEINDVNKLKDTLFVLTMPNTDLLAQAKIDLQESMNATVTNLTYFRRELESLRSKPKLIIIDECHYGSNEKAVRYEKLFDYIENENQECNVVFISATPLSALLAAENDAILRKNLTTKLLFHKASDDYLGITKMMNQGQVISLDAKTRNLLNKSEARERFINHVKASENPGWALVRVPSGSVMDAKNMLIKEGFRADNIFILGSSLSGVNPKDLIDVDQLKIEYDQRILFGEKIIAITVAGLRAGINFGQDMKEGLLASWDSTVSTVAAIVQANIGRACGYHANNNALHFTNISGVKAYADIVAYLEENCTTSATDNLEGLKITFENICRNYKVNGLDAGATLAKGKKNKVNSSIYEYKAFHTDSYLIVPGKLNSHYDYSQYTDDPEYLKSIKLVRETLIKGGLTAKSSRSLPPNSNSIANWVNGDTFSNKEKAGEGGPIFEKVTSFITSLDMGRDIVFNDVIPAGGGVDIKTRSIAVYIFSIYNKSSRKDISKKIMGLSDVHEVADAYNVPPDDTILVLFKKGEESESLTNNFINDKIKEAEKSSINQVSKFKRNYS